MGLQPSGGALGSGWHCLPYALRRLPGLTPAGHCGERQHRWPRFNGRVSMNRKPCLKPPWAGEMLSRNSDGEGRCSEVSIALCSLPWAPDTAHRTLSAASRVKSQV